MRVVHHHYSSGIDQRSGGERKRKRTREDEKIFFFFFLEIKLRNWTFPTILSLPVLILVNMDSNRNCLINVCLFTAVCMHNHMEGRVVYVARAMCAHPLLLVYNSREECSCILYGFIFQPLEVKAHLSEWVWRQNLLPHGFRPGWGLRGWWDTGKAHPPRGGRLLQQGKRKELPMWLLQLLDVGQARTEPKPH